jgi:hypothetical protein
VTAQSVTPYDPQFAAAGVANNVDPNLLAAMGAVESGYNPSAVSPAGAQGLLQLMPGTAQAMGVTNPGDPGQSANGGAKYLSQGLDATGNVPDALRYYNAGPDRSHWDNPQTNAYVAKVQAAYQDIVRAGGIQYAQADTGTASDANTGVAPVAGRPSDAAMTQMLTGDSGAAPAASSPTGPPAPASPDTVQPVAGRPSDAQMMQMLTGAAPAATSASAAPSAAQASSQAPAASGAAPSASPAPPSGWVPPHLAPDGSGAMTNVSDADYYRLTGQTPSQGVVAPSGAGSPISAAPGGPQGAPGAPVAVPASPSSSGGPTIPPWMMAAGAGAADAYRGIARSVANGAGWVDSHVPALASLDNSTGFNPQGVSGAILADINANRQKYGSSPAYVAGNIGGDIAASLPLMAVGGAGIGALGDAAATAVPGIANALLDAGNAVRAVKGGNLLLNVGGRAASGAAQGAGIAAATSGGSNAPFLQQVKEGAETGGIAGVALPAAVGVLKGVARTAMGGSTNAETAALAAQAKGYGIPITLGQLSENPSVRFVDSASKRIPFSGSDGQAVAQQTAFNRAVGGTIGQSVDKVTPQVMTAAKQQIGATLNGIESNNPVTLDGPFLSQVASIEHNARLSLPDGEFSVVSRQLSNIMSNLQSDDTITGQTYGNLIHKGSPLDAALNSRDSNVANYAGQIKGALQDALTRSLSPADAATYTQARYQYKNLKTIEGLVEKSATGDISPAGLMQAVRTSYGDMAYSGGGDLGNLARIGQRFLKEPPSSGTAERLSTLEAMTRAGGVMGGVLTGVTHPGDAAALAATAVGTLGLARGARAYLGSQVLANRLIQRGLNPNAAPGLINRLTSAATTASPAVAALTGNRLLEPRQRELQGR